MSEKYVIVRNSSDGGGYVAKSGSSSSYTRSLSAAEKFSSKDDAERQCCGNERAIPLQPLLDEIAS